jgi:hypothetical protein
VLILSCSSNNQKCSTVTYTGIQHSLEQADSDVLILLDSCSSGIGDGGEGHGVTELMAACAFDAIANGVGHYSFTKALTTELRLLSKKRSFPVVELYQKVYCRAQHHMPQGIKNERYPAPILLQLTRDNIFPRGIQLSVQERSSAPNQVQRPGSLQGQTPIKEHGSTKRRRDYDVDTFSNKRPRLDSEEDLREDSMDSAPEPPETSQTAIQLFQEELGERSTVIPGPNQMTEKNSPVPSELQSTTSQCSRDAPRLLFSIRLQENIKAEDLSVEYFADWLRIIPAIAEEVTVEGVFKSDSTLVLLALPFSLWPYLSPHPAVVNLGPIRSSNILPQKAPNHWPNINDWSFQEFLGLDSDGSFNNNILFPEVFLEGGQEHPGLNNKNPTTENVSSSATFLATPDPSYKTPFDFNAMDEDNESDLWSRRPSTFSEMSTEYQHSIFDATPLLSSSQGISHSVSSSRRQGHFYPDYRESTTETRKVETCWTCRFSRIRVSTNTSNGVLL